MRKDFLNFTSLGQNFIDLQNDIRLGLPTAGFGMSFAQKCLTASLIEKPIIYICDNAVNAEKVEKEISGFTTKKVVRLIAKDEVLLYKNAVSKDNLFKRLCSVFEIENNAEIIVCDIEAILQLFPLKIESIDFVQGADVDYFNLPKRLVDMGYKRESEVTAKGVFAVHGDILDIYPINVENPVRIDFFGDNIEKIKPYDFQSGERLSNIEKITVISASDIKIEKDEVNDIKNTLIKEVSSTQNPIARTRKQAIYDDICLGLENLSVSNGFLTPLLKNTCDFFGLIPEDFLVVIDEGKLIYDKLNAIYKEHEERFSSLLSDGELFSFSKNQLIDKNEFLAELSRRQCLGVQTFFSSLYLFNPLNTHKFSSSPVTRYINGVETLIIDIKSWLANHYRILLFCGNSARQQKLSQILSDEYLPLVKMPKTLDEFKGVCVLEDTLPNGLILHDAKLVILGENDLYTKTSVQKRIKRKRADLFTAPEIGDYAVHETHGIGKIAGTKKIVTTDGTKEYIAIEYRGGDTLYVPVEQMDVLSKYMGGENPQLSKIGGGEFDRIKEKVKESLKKLAFDLKKLYAERSQKKGFKCEPYDEFMEEFESAFPYEETPDQATSIQEIKDDLTSSKIMDRLLCGDVGYGKTEVAFRACYLEILNGKQVAFMCPSTILSQQHFETAKKRFENFGVKIECLNRFKSEKQQQIFLDKLIKGEIDLLIGTHRLLSKDVQYKNLGLLILDEEQRFGVEHKEKIKNIKNDIDCLTMTATPIPRTLHMSLSGIRDISTIETPPSQRLPVQTYVVEETESLIRDACIRELARGGQVFILYNRVESINTFAMRVAEIVPEAKICIAHGRMDKNMLEDNVFKFYGGEKNILITTTIIENGIDLPNANTLIVIDSDRLGVSQLYQLRGRVGRGSRLAHAYFTFKPERVMTSNASERLKAITEFTELGAGFKIAVRDLEIRGAGNVLGAEQHGHLDKVGYELYSKLLKEEMTGESHEAIDLDIKVSAYIPESYIESSAGRLDCYKQIAEIRTTDDYKRVCSSIEENYGKMPKEVLNLLIIAVLKGYATIFNTRKIILNKNECRLQMPSINTFKDQRIIKAINTFEKNVSIDMSIAPMIVYKSDEKKHSAEGIMLEVIKFLKFATTFTQN